MNISIHKNIKKKNNTNHKNGMRWGVRRVYLCMFVATLLGYALGSAPLHVLYIRACDTLNFATSFLFVLPRFWPGAIYTSAELALVANAMAFRTGHPKSYHCDHLQ